jgi:copper chaperone CopZ
VDTVYTVTGMTCQHCVNHVKEAVGAIPGVSAVDVRLDDGRLVVGSADLVDFALVEAAVREAGDGYAVQLGGPPESGRRRLGKLFARR